jgi:diadenosine tetraphosphate (Ap4A) HIT family hydrolase
VPDIRPAVGDWGRGEDAAIRQRYPTVEEGMMSTTDRRSWAEKVAGLGCPVCVPQPSADRDELEIARLRASTLYLKRDQRFRGYCILIFNLRHASDLTELHPDEYEAFMLDLRQATGAVRTALRPDHMNLECLGNVVPHLHWHLFPRYQGDPRWGKPVWAEWAPGAFEGSRVVLPDGEYRSLVEIIRAAVR